MTPKTNEELHTEIDAQMEASVQLGTNVRSVKFDREHFAKSMIDIIQLERMKAMVNLNSPLSQFIAGREWERQAVLEYIKAIAQRHPQAALLSSILDDIQAGVHRPECG